MPITDDEFALFLSGGGATDLLEEPTIKKKKANQDLISDSDFASFLSEGSSPDVQEPQLQRPTGTYGPKFNAGSIDSIFNHSQHNIDTGNYARVNGGIATSNSMVVNEDRLNNRRTTLIPSVYDGRILEKDEAIQRALEAGADKWPTYDTIDEAIADSRWASKMMSQQRGFSDLLEKEPQSSPISDDDFALFLSGEEEPELNRAKQPSSGTDESVFEQLIDAPKDFVVEAGKGLVQGGIGMASGVTNLAGLGADMLGFDETSESLMQTAKDIRGSGVAKATALDVASFGDISNVEDFAKWAGGVFGSTAPLMVASGGTALAVRAALPTVGRWAALAAGGAVTGAEATGNLHGDIFEATGSTDHKAEAIIGGIASGTLEMIGVGSILKKFGMLKEVKEKVVERALKNGFKETIKGGLKQAGVEGSTEGLQSIATQLAMYSADETKDILSSEFGIELARNIRDSVAGGALVGGGLGGLGSFKNVTKENRAIKDAELAKDVAEGRLAVTQDGKIIELTETPPEGLDIGETPLSEGKVPEMGDLPAEDNLTQPEGDQTYVYESPVDKQTFTDEQTTSVALELDYGDGAPYHEKFPEFGKLSPERKAEVTKNMINYVTAEIESLTGVKVVKSEHGTGYWQKWESPNASLELVGSKEATKEAMSILGRVLQQTEVYGTKSSTNRTEATIQIFSPELTEKNRGILYKALREEFPDEKGDLYIEGSSPTTVTIDGENIPASNFGIKTDKITKEDAMALMKPTLDKLSIGGLKTQAVGTEKVSVTNDWTKNKAGEDYRLGISEESVINDLIPRFEEKLKRELAGEKDPPIPKLTTQTETEGVAVPQTKNLEVQVVEETKEVHSPSNTEKFLAINKRLPDSLEKNPTDEAVAEYDSLSSTRKNRARVEFQKVAPEDVGVRTDTFSDLKKDEIKSLLKKREFAQKLAESAKGKNIKKANDSLRVIDDKLRALTGKKVINVGELHSLTKKSEKKTKVIKAKGPAVTPKKPNLEATAEIAQPTGLADTSTTEAKVDPSGIEAAQAVALESRPADEIVSSVADQVKALEQVASTIPARNTKQRAKILAKINEGRTHIGLDPLTDLSEATQLVGKGLKVKRKKADSSLEFARLSSTLDRLKKSGNFKGTEIAQTSSSVKATRKDNSLEKKSSTKVEAKPIKEAPSTTPVFKLTEGEIGKKRMGTVYKKVTARYKEMPESERSGMADISTLRNKDQINRGIEFVSKDIEKAFQVLEDPSKVPSDLLYSTVTVVLDEVMKGVTNPDVQARYLSAIANQTTRFGTQAGREIQMFSNLKPEGPAKLAMEITKSNIENLGGEKKVKEIVKAEILKIKSEYTGINNLTKGEVISVVESLSC
tara:strand:- start:7988 stop:12067 length:4080 start_codon:yes stop_codon:yes gene_type:complete